ncbi:MAG: hypothetical protein JNL12_03605 [Planctomycetes bacterium]|nr:hypothetical protein [Planctomycetota bacterium]
MPHSLLRSVASTLLLVVLTLPLAAQVPTADAPAPAPTDDPLAVLAAKEPHPPERSGMRIVVQKPDGSPAAAAVVVFTPWRDDAAGRAERAAASQQHPGDEPRRFAVLAASGTRYRVDERGATRVPRQGYVLAFEGELAVRRFVSETSTEPRVLLTLAPPRVHTVEVVTTDGDPVAAVPITLRDTERHTPIRMGTSGPDGTATFRLLSPRPSTAVVQLEVASQAAREAPLPAPGERVRLPLPATTAVEASFAGDLVPGGALEWTLQCGDAAPAIVGERTGERSARWPFVERGAAFAITVQSGRLQLATTTGTATPTTEPVALVRSQANATFAMQILDPSGAAARDSAVTLQWRRPRSSNGDWTRTNGEGWIEVAMPDGLVGAKDVELVLELADEPGGPLRGRGKVAVQAAGKTRTELPPLRCEAPPLLVSGDVVTADGKAVADLEVETHTNSYQRVRTDQAGRFALFGEVTLPTVRLGVESTWCLVAGPPWHVTVPPGTKDLRLVVQRAARVRFASDLQGNFLSRIGYRLEPAAGEGEAVDLPFSLGQRELHAPPGHWHFVVHQGGRVLHRLPDLRCESGVEAHDPRFMAFDWRAYAIAVEVRVRDANGRPTDECTVWLREGGTGHGTSPTNGVVKLLLPKDGAEVEVAPRGGAFPKVDLGVVTTDQDVVLGGGPALTVRLQPMPQLPEGFELVLSLGEHDGVPFDASGKAMVRAPRAGAAAPRILLRKGNTTTRLLPWELGTVDVPEAGTTLPFELTRARQEVLDQQVALLRNL